MGDQALPVILTLYRGATGTLIIKLRERVNEITTQGYDLSGFATVTITGDSRENPDNAATRLFQKSVATSGLTDATSGDLEFSFVSGDWSSSPLDTLEVGCYFVDIWGIEGGGAETHIIKGIFNFGMDLKK